MKLDGLLPCLLLEECEEKESLNADDDDKQVNNSFGLIALLAQSVSHTLDLPISTV